MNFIAGPAGLDTVYTVNYGTNPPNCNAGGDPQTNAGDLAAYAVAHGYGIKYYEIGNEQWGTGGYTIDLHHDTNGNYNPFLSNYTQPSTYPTYEPAFYDAIKAADPSALVAVPITTGVGSYAGMVNYSLPCMANCKYDAIVYHGYPAFASMYDNDLLYNSSQQGLLRAMETLLLNYSKPKNAIWVTEWDGAPGGSSWNRQTMSAASPLFTVAQLASFMDESIPVATYWLQMSSADYCLGPGGYDTSNPGPNGSYNWSKGGGTFALWRGAQPVGPNSQGCPGLKPGDIFPAGRGLQVLGQSGFVMDGEHMLRTYSDAAGAPWLQAWGATHGDGHRALILINRDRDQAHTVPVKIDGLSSGINVQQWTYGRAQYDYTALGDWSKGPVQQTYCTSWTGTFSAALAALSVSVLVF